jgi:hypothetical protein
MPLSRSCWTLPAEMPNIFWTSLALSQRGLVVEVVFPVCRRSNNSFLKSARSFLVNSSSGVMPQRWGWLTIYWRLFCFWLRVMVFGFLMVELGVNMVLWVSLAGRITAKRAGEKKKKRERGWWFLLGWRS